MATRSRSRARPPQASQQGLAEDVPDSNKAETQVKNLGWSIAFMALLVSRYFSAKSNLLHDCDEVFNYWEPLHYLLYKSGFQTWEYSSEFALRSYLYLMLHAIVAGPASWLYGTGVGKIGVFYGLRMALAVISAATEATLAAAVSRKYGQRLAAYTLLLLCFTTGMFNASTSFLPSTFSMYGITLSAAALIAGRPCAAVAVAAISVIIGWPFSILAAAPIVIYALVAGNTRKVFLAGLQTSVGTLALSILFDRYFYRRWTSSVLNLVVYNVLGGDGSALYGVEGPLFYLRNLVNNFNIAFVLQLSVFAWLGFMTLQAHKEERFLYPVYPLICLSAALFIEKLPDLAPQALIDFDDRTTEVFKFARQIAMTLIIILSYSRNTALLHGYSAPMDVYRHLPAEQSGSWMHQGNGTIMICVGSEWHRYPSSFFLPSPKYKVSWLDDGFGGLLPLPFDPSLGGTAAAPPHFNNRNQASPEQFLKDEEQCAYLIELQLERPGRSYRGLQKGVWQVIRQKAFLDNEKSGTASRAIFVPWVWEKVNVFAWYRLLRRARFNT